MVDGNAHDIHGLVFSFLFLVWWERERIKSKEIHTQNCYNAYHSFAYSANRKYPIHSIRNSLFLLYLFILQHGFKAFMLSVSVRLHIAFLFLSPSLDCCFDFLYPKINNNNNKSVLFCRKQRIKLMEEVRWESICFWFIFIFNLNFWNNCPCVCVCMDYTV